ncbi:hypothetical protein OKW96_16240 [Sphingobacterium sp. KU25419]|nr:hypothetical protein OKW96_16240 [Sphingobacterium sp. KU25419]
MRKKEKPELETRELPLFQIGGTDFFVDIQRHQLREKDNPHNRITLGNVKEEYGFSFFYYDTLTKNRYNGGTAELPERVMLIIMPPLKELDPIGLARKHGLRDNHYENSRDKRTAESLPQLRKSNANKQISKRLK